MGHRVMNHKSKCKNLHGHRYKAGICLSGKVVEKAGISDEGMVIDFCDIKAIVMEQIHDVLDHGFMVWDKDPILVEFYRLHPEQKHIFVPFTPTSENIALWIFKKLDQLYKDTYGTGLKLHEVKLWETPTSLAICSRKDAYGK